MYKKLGVISIISMNLLVISLIFLITTLVLRVFFVKDIFFLIVSITAFAFWIFKHFIRIEAPNYYEKKGLD